MHHGWSALCAAVASAGIACASSIQVEASSDMRARVPRRVVVLPFEAASERVDLQAAELVTSRMLAELSEMKGLILISPVDVRVALETGEGDSRAILLRAFAPDAVLSGVVQRFEGRTSSAGDALGPASVAFEVRLDAPDGTRLWNGRYAERQRGLSEDLTALRRNWSRGFQWVAPERLARDGARALAMELGRSWSGAKEH